MLILWKIIISVIYRYAFLKFITIFYEITVLGPVEYKSKAIDPSK